MTRVENHKDDLLDQALASTFPASDPLALTSTAIAAIEPTETPVQKRAATPKKARANAKTYTLYGASGGGSMIVEAAFGFTKLPVEFVDLPWDDTGWKSKTLSALNPLGQVPTLVLPDGTVMTESAAIILHLADKVTGFKLVPPPRHGARPAFLRWLMFLVAAVYPTFTYGDVTERWVGTGHKEGAGKALREGTDEHRRTIWRFVETQVEGPWFLGKTLSALDLYMWMMTKWRPGADWFKAECPKLYAIGAAMNDHPVCKKVMARNKL
jgi:GST-like protein